MSARWTGQRIELGKDIVSDRVLLTVRSERVVFENKAKNTFEGVIENVNFLGKTSRYEVDVGGKTLVVQTAKHPELKHGHKVFVHLPPGDITVFEDFDSADYKMTFD
jgi:ABC-type Fe3+/spermidine/putrescine transport system ATPase subunit